MDRIKTKTGMLKWNSVSIISYLLNIILLSLLCYFLYVVISNSAISSTSDIYLKRDLQNRPFLGFVFLILVIYILHFLVIKIIFSNSNIFYGYLIRVLISIVFVWYFASLYRTSNVFILMQDPRVYAPYVPLLLMGIVLPFSEALIIKLLEKRKKVTEI